MAISETGGESRIFLRKASGLIKTAGTFDTFIYDIGLVGPMAIVLGGEGVHGDGGGDAVLFQYVQDPEDAHPVAVLPVGHAGKVGEGAGRRSSGQISRLVAPFRRDPFHLVQGYDDA